MDIDRKDRKYWKFGFLYFNPADKAVFVPKRSGYGLTGNFANPLSILITVAIVVVIALIISLVK